MERMEMVEKIRERANITIEEARDVLEAHDWDMLEAMVDLERQGKVEEGTKTKSCESSSADYEKVSPTVTGKNFHKHGKDAEKNGFGRKIKRVIRRIVRIGLDNQFIIQRNEEELVRVPVIIPVICLFAAFWLCVIAFVVGLFLDLKYSFEGKELGKEEINKTMRQAGDFAQKIVNDAAEKAENEDEIIVDAEVVDVEEVK